MVPGLILAAGRSSRMGRPKALLPCGHGGASFLDTVVAVLAAGGLDDVVVVGKTGDGALRAEVERVGAGSAGLRLRYAANPDAESGQLSSVLAGLRLADRPGVPGVLVIPVDMPLVAPATVARLLERFRAGTAPVVRPVHGGRHGHPVIFNRSVFDELRRADPSAGARAVVRAHGRAVADVEVDDPGVLQDVDTPEDYARLLAARPGAPPA